MTQQGTKALQRELRELEIQLQRLGGDVSQVIPQGFNAAAETAGNLRKVISDLKEELREITQGSGFLNSFSTHIKNILKDQTKLTNAFEAGNNVVKSMTTNAQELAKSAQGYKKLSTDQLETKMKEQQELMRIAKLAQEEFKYKRNLTDEEKEIYRALKQSQKAHESITAEIQKQLEVTKKQDDVAKLAGKGLDAMSKIPLVGKMMDTKKGMEAVNKAAEDGKEPIWRGLLSWAKVCEDGAEKAVWLSDMHPYPHDRMHQKIAEIKGPYACMKMDSENPGICTKCKHWGKITNPLILGREIKVDNTAKEIMLSAPAEEDFDEAELDSEEAYEPEDTGLPLAPSVVRPVPPRGYSYGEHGGVYCTRTEEDEEGKKSKKNIQLVPYDLFVVDLLKMENDHLIHMAAVRPEGVQTLNFPQKSIVSKDETLKWLASQVVF